MRKNTTKNTIIGLIVLCAAIVIVYFAIVNIPKDEEKVVMTAAAKELTQNFDKDYPPTPREVLKHYAEISKCYYDPETTEDQIYSLAKMMRQLQDDELNNNQSFDDFVASLRAEILQYRDEKKTIASYSVSPSTEVKYTNNEYGSLSTLFLTYNTRTNGVIGSVKEEYILRMDPDGHWKVLGWQMAN